MKSTFELLRKQRMALPLLGALALFSACNNEDRLSSDFSDNRTIGFDALTNRSTGSSLKSAVMTTELISSFKVWSVIQGEVSALPNLDGKEVSRTGSPGSWDDWNYTPKQQWPESGLLDFYAYSPATPDGSISETFTFDANPANTVAKITYTVPAPDDQEDLLVGLKKDVNAANPALVEMSFEHVLSRVQIKARAKASGNSYKIHGVGLINLKDAGELEINSTNFPSGGFVYNDLYPGADDTPGSKTFNILWNTSSDNADSKYEKLFETPVDITSNTAYTNVLVDDDAFMVMPQETALGQRTASQTCGWDAGAVTTVPDYTGTNFVVQLVYTDENDDPNSPQVVYLPVVEPLDPAKNAPITFEAGRQYTMVVDMSGVAYIDLSAAVSLYNDAWGASNPVVNITGDSDPALAANYQPVAHVGFAGSNIYWNGTALTFDAVGETAHEHYQGVFFKQGSLVGIDPKTDPYGGTVTLYLPNSTNGNYLQGTATSFGLDTWSSILTGLESFDGSTFGDAAAQRAYAPVTWLSSVLNPDWLTANRAAFKGDICAYLSGRPDVPEGTWRMPTSSDFGDAGNYTRVEGSSGYSSGAFPGTSSLTEATDGTCVIDFGYSFTDPTASSTVFFPASGYRSNSAGAVSYVGVIGLAWSSSPNGTNGYYLYFNGTSVDPAHNNNRAYGFPVRCVKKK